AKRVVTPDAVIARDPQVILASWCGRKVNPKHIAARAGWERVSAVRGNEIHEVKSTLILQPGPAALTDGVREIHSILAQWAGRSDG
ncbi:MAG: hypothetical protein JNL98_41385, partial [Bryobacterales bacterium]|nr:hypothetical protein [Bryobacterales bacterium]